MVDDMVIGVIVERLGDNYRVDVGAASSATLPILGFDGATKKTRPQLNVSRSIRVRNSNIITQVHFMNICLNVVAR